MSKMGNYNMELEEELRDQLNKLGFETLQDALDAGWGVYSGELVKQKDELAKAHEAWLKEKDKVVKDLDEIARYFEVMGYPENYIPSQHAKKLRKAIKFVKEAHD